MKSLWGGRVATVAILLVPTTFSAWLRRDELLNGDVLYATGGLRRSMAGGVPFEEIFIARPYAYKVIVAALNLTASGGSSAIDYATQHRMQLVTLAALLVMAALLLGALRRWYCAGFATIVTTAVSASVALAPKWDLLEPDWVAAVVAVCAFSAALLPRSERIGWVLGGMLMCLTGTVKLSTAAFAATVVVLLWLVDRRRALGAAAVAIVVASAWFVLSRIFQPIEWMWFDDQAALVHDSPIHRAPRLSDLGDLLFALTNKMVVSPILMTLPAVAALYIMGGAGRADRRRRGLVGSLLLCSALASGYAQGEWFLYHFANLPILAAGLWAAAAADANRRVQTILVVAPVLVSALAVAAMTQPALAASSANTYLTVAVWSSAIVTATCCVRWASPAEHRVSRPVPLLAAVAAAGCAVGLAGTLPASTLAYSGSVNATSATRAPYDADALKDVLQARSDSVDRLTDRLGGPQVPVLYLTYGGRTALLPFPSTCAYPSPQWLQRAAALDFVESMDSYRANFECVTDPRPKWLIVQPDWMDIPSSPPALQSALSQRYDCSRSLPTIVEGLVVCPRR